MGDAARRRSKKKGKDNHEASVTGPQDASAGISAWTVTGLASQSGLVPLVLLSPAELQQTGFEPKDLMLVTSASGTQTVAVCDTGGREGLWVSPTILKSLRIALGDSVSLRAGFNVLEAKCITVGVSNHARQRWHRLLGKLQLELYMTSAFDGLVVVKGDIREMTLNGESVLLHIMDCEGKDASEDLGMWLCTRSTRWSVATGDDVSDPGSPPKSVMGFQQVGGLRSVIAELVEAVQLPLERPEAYRSMGITAPRGVLLYGPPGTGKTLLARSLAQELSCPVTLCSATDFVGASREPEEQIKATFQRCREQGEAAGKGALLFIDEIDAICPKRDDSSEFERRMVAALLVALDGVNSGDGLIVLGATNRPDSIDPALRRAGRLERELEVGVPNREDREHILGIHLSRLKHSLGDEERKELARRCHGYVGADLRSLLNCAARASLSLQRPLTMDSCFTAMKLVPPSALKELLVEIPETRWQDIGGYENTKQALRETVEWPVKKFWAFEALRIEPPRGVLMYGPPGCSKTMMAKAVATESEMNFISVKGPELFSKYVGDSERAVRDIFRKARTAAPCVIFFDEIDAVGSSRDGDSGGGVSSRVLAQLLTEMDGIWSSRSQKFVVVLAATNRPQVLDPALLRPGRFDRLVHVPLPDAEARRQIFSAQLEKMQAGRCICATELAEETERYSGAEVVMICREAALLAIRSALENGEDGDVQPRLYSEHFRTALVLVRPRLDVATIRFYEEFERSRERR